MRRDPPCVTVGVRGSDDLDYPGPNEIPLAQLIRLDDVVGLVSLNF